MSLVHISVSKVLFLNQVWWELDRPNRITQFKSPRVKMWCVLYFQYNVAFTFYSQRVELGTILSSPIWSIVYFPAKPGLK